MFSLRLENIVDITIIAYYHEIIFFEQGMDIYPKVWNGPLDDLKPSEKKTQTELKSGAGCDFDSG